MLHHANCVRSVYTEEIGASTICEGSTVAANREDSSHVTVDVMQRPSSSHLLLQLAQVTDFLVQP
jgi:hypothetical protein